MAVNDIFGENWSGEIQFNEANFDRVKARGRVKGYSWHFQSNTDSWVIEIAEDISLEPSDLPLVGFGCGGWVHQSGKLNFPSNKSEFIALVSQALISIFELYDQNKLVYLPTVTCACSE